MHRKTYEYAESFEDFIRMVKSTKDLEVLKHIRYNIVTEIMQATTVQNVKRAQGLDPENNALGNSDAIRARKLKRYISQLTYAKNTCECHMQTLGWDGYPRQVRRKLSFTRIAVTRQYFVITSFRIQRSATPQRSRKAGYFRCRRFWIT